MMDVCKDSIFLKRYKYINTHRRIAFSVNYNIV